VVPTNDDRLLHQLTKRLRIGINAQIPLSSGAGGIETVLRVLALLGTLDGDEEYVFIGHPTAEDWLTPLMGDRQTVVRPLHSSTGSPSEHPRSKIRDITRRIVTRARRNLLKGTRVGSAIPSSNGFYESLGCDVIHFPYQDFVECRLPTVYNPHDLQHVHLPQYFTAEELRRREMVYPTACRSAHAIVVASRDVKKDLVEKYRVNSNKIHVIPWALPPPSTPVDDAAIRDLLERYDLTSKRFLLYPAMTWEHKNHIRLIEAVAMLRDRGRVIKLCCTGQKKHHFANIEKRVIELNLTDHVRFTGMIDHKELAILYRNASAVVVPSLFEAASAPLFEAWTFGVPVACSSISTLMEQAGDAALFFDPLSVDEIADAIDTLSTDDHIAQTLVKRGHARLRSFDLETTLKSYRAVYRRAAGRILKEEDRELLRNNETEFVDLPNT
jgi:glycosyltransferase involved in cell wall biosynthesis